MMPQAAAVPYRFDEQGLLCVLLVTSRTRRRWIIPKGKVPVGMLPKRAAEREAFEEAGVAGLIAPEIIGTYRQGDAIAAARGGNIVVHAYALEVRDELPAWHEMHMRERRWFTFDEALKAVRDPQIRALLREFEKWIRARRSEVR